MALRCVLGFESTIVGGEIATSIEHPEVAFFAQVRLDSLVESRGLRGSHVVLAISALTAGRYLDHDVVMEVPPSEPSRTNSGSGAE